MYLCIVRGFVCHHLAGSSVRCIRGQGLSVHSVARGYCFCLCKQIHAAGCKTCMPENFAEIASLFQTCLPPLPCQAHAHRSWCRRRIVLSSTTDLKLFASVSQFQNGAQQQQTRFNARASGTSRHRPAPVPSNQP